MASGPITSEQMEGWKAEAMTDFIFLAPKITVNGDCRHEIKSPWKERYDSILKSSWQYFVIKIPYSQSFGFPSSCVQIWDLDHKEGWAPKNWWFGIVMLEKTPESLDSQEIKQVNPKGNPPWIFIGRTVAEAEALILRPPDAKSWLILKYPVGKYWRTEGEGREQRMRWLNGITYSIDISLSKLWKIVKDKKTWHAAGYEVAKSWTQLSDWIKIKLWWLESAPSLWLPGPLTTEGKGAPHPGRGHTDFWLRGPLAAEGKGALRPGERVQASGWQNRWGWGRHAGATESTLLWRTRKLEPHSTQGPLHIEQPAAWAV